MQSPECVTVAGSRWSPSLLAGEGSFGRVLQAKAEGIVPGMPERNVVAIKTTKGGFGAWLLGLQCVRGVPPPCRQRHQCGEGGAAGGTRSDEGDGASREHPQPTGPVHHARYHSLG